MSRARMDSTRSSRSRSPMMDRAKVEQAPVIAMFIGGL
jgi:hypothetical protein